MDHLIAIIGHSDSGKTTLVEMLVPAFKRRGYRVGTIKHAHHAPDFDKRGKDSWRHFEAGSDVALVASDTTLAMITHRREGTGADGGIAGLAPYFRDVDIVIAEGFKTADCPKVEVYRAAEASPPLCRSVEGVIAVVTDAATGFPVRQFDFAQLPELVFFIERRIFEPPPGSDS